MTDTAQGTGDWLMQDSTPEGADRAVESCAEGSEVADLTARMARGNEPAWHCFFQTYFDRLFRYLIVVSGGREELAQDALQNTLVRVARHVRCFPSEPVFWSWLTVLARSALRDEDRKTGRYRRLLQSFLAETKAEPSVAGPEDAQLQEALDQCLKGLPETERHLLEQKYLQQLSVREMAGQARKTEKAVESRLSRIRLRLRLALLDRLGDSPTIDPP